MDKTVLFELKETNGARVEVRECPSGSFAVLCFPVGCDPHTTGSNFFDSDSAALEAVAWLMDAHSAAVMANVRGSVESTYQNHSQGGATYNRTNRC